MDKDLRNDEKTLLQRVKNKDLKAFNIIVEKYSKRLFSSIYRITHNADDTEDVMQEVWIRFYKNIEKFRGDSSIFTFLYRIGVNTAINHIKKRQRNDFWRDLIPFMKNPKGPEEEVIKNEEIDKLYQGVEGLPAKQKSVFVLRNEEDLSFAQIGEILGIQENNAKVNYHHALVNLKKFLKKEKML